MNPIVIDGKRTRIQPRPLARSGPAAGARAKLIGALQERFGYSRERAERELKRRMARHHAHGTKR